MDPIFLEVAVILAIASVLSIIFRFFKQPPILAYILTGIILGPLGLVELGSEDFLHVLASFGITFLLFLLGLELRVGDLKSVGKISLITGIGQIVITSLVGLGIAMTLGFGLIPALYVSVALTFSSTIIIVKLLSDKRDTNSLYGRISIGFLLVQDFCAIVALILLSGLGGESTVSPFIQLPLVLLKGIGLFILTILVSKYVFPPIISFLSKNNEIFFLFSIAWAFGVAALVSSPLIGFSIEIGGFLAGLALANSSQNLHIAAKIRPIRDFFITIFFVMLGMQLMVADVASVLLPAILLSVFVLVGNPLIVLSIMGAMGYKKRTAFFAGLTVAQISEFSLIVVFMGQTIGHLSSDVITLVTLVGVITFTLSTYMILYNNKLYKLLAPYLSIFERKKIRESYKKMKEYKGHIILIGANRTGGVVLKALQDLGENVVVIDFDPLVTKDLRKNGIEVIFGDVSDADILDKANAEHAFAVISTITDKEDSLILMQGLKNRNNRIKTISLAYDQDSAEQLYGLGIDYVVVPHISGGKEIADLIKKNKLDSL